MGDTAICVHQNKSFDTWVTTVTPRDVFLEKGFFLGAGVNRENRGYKVLSDDYFGEFEKIQASQSVRSFSEVVDITFEVVWKGENLFLKIEVGVFEPVFVHEKMAKKLAVGGQFSYKLVDLVRHRLNLGDYTIRLVRCQVTCTKNPSRMRWVGFVFGNC